MSSVTALEIRTASMRQALLRNLILLTLLTAGTILTITLVAGHRSVQQLSKSLIASTDLQTESRLRRFFDPVDAALATLRGWAEHGTLEFEDDRALNELLMPLVGGLSAVSSVLLANTDGEEFMLLRSSDGWWTRRTRIATWGRRTQWSLWQDPRSLVAEEWRELDYDPRQRPWYEGALARAAQDDPAPYWTEPYTFFTAREPGITVSTWAETAEASALIIALDVSLMDVSSFTSQLDVSARGMAVVLTSDTRVLGLPRSTRFRSREAMQAAVLSRAESLGISALADAVTGWLADGAPSEQVISLRSGGEGWWAGFRPFDLSPERRLWIGVTVPESDFLGPVKRQRNQVLIIGLVAVIVAVAMALLMDRTFRRKVQKAIQAARQLGQYRLEEEIGSGAMGTVFHAQHAMLRRPTAVKLLRADLADDETAMARFEREAQLTSRLNHPNTIAIYDYGKTPEAVFYYAMEYLVGVDLLTLVRRAGPQAPGRVIYLLRQVCGSLEEAHGIGLIHRDIKPSNIMLTERAGDPDFVKVLDFGLVKEFEGSEKAELTTLQSMAGTPHYISPEAILEPQGVGPPGDLYALGAVGYFLLTGQPVFNGKTMVEICTKHLNEPVTSPSTRLGQPLPRDLEVLILSCLAKTPEERPGGAAELASALARCADAGHWGPAQARRWWAAHPDLCPAGAPAGPEGKAKPHSAALAVDLRSR